MAPCALASPQLAWLALRAGRGRLTQRLLACRGVRRWAASVLLAAVLVGGHLTTANAASVPTPRLRPVPAVLVSAPPPVPVRPSLQIPVSDAVSAKVTRWS